MKKALSIALVLLMAFSLFACNKDSGGGSNDSAPSNASSSAAPSGDSGSSSGGGNSSAPAQTSSAPPSADEFVFTGQTGDDPMDKIGFFDPDYDYTQNKRYVVQYLVNDTGILNEQASDAMAHWCNKMNIEYLGLWNAANDRDLYMNTLSTLANQLDGFVVDPDATLYYRVVEILEEAGKPWMGFMAPPTNLELPGEPIMGTYVGHDHYDFGVHKANKLFQYKDELWPDVPNEEFGFLSVNMSTIPPINMRTIAAKDVFDARPGWNPEQWFEADCAVGALNADTGSQVSSAVFAANPQYEYWLCTAANDDVAIGVANALESFGYTDHSAVVTCGGSGLQIQFEAGVQNAWRSAFFSAQSIYAEGVIGALYAFMSGQATPETLWPSWRNINNKGDIYDEAGNLVEEHNYAMVILPSVWIDYDNYQHYLAWSDLYSGMDYYPQYSKEGITREDFNPRMDVPERYNIKN